jgi:hypothetical protein
MNTTVLLISIVGSVVLVVLALLFIAGFLFRCDLARMRAARFSAPQLTRDPLALKDTLVEFFALSKGSSRIIRLLSAKRKPVGYQALVDEIRFDKKWRRDSDELPASAIPAVLGIMQLAGIVRITRHGFSITEVGREVQRRIEPEPRAQMPKVRAIRSISSDGRRPATTLSSSDHTVLREHRNGARTLIHQ